MAEYVGVIGASNRQTSVLRGLTISYHPGIRMPKFYNRVSVRRGCGKGTLRTTVIGILGAFGKMNLTCTETQRVLAVQHLKGSPFVGRNVPPQTCFAVASSSLNWPSLH